MGILWTRFPVFMLTLRQFAGGKAVRVVAGIMAIPIAFAVVWAFAATPDENSLNFMSESIFRLLFIATLLPVAVLILATGALGNEIEDQTLPYLTLKPVSRLRIVVEKLSATVVVATPLAWLGLAIAFFITLGGDATDSNNLQILGAMVAATVGGVLAYGSIFMLVSLYAARALLAGITYVLVWESLLGRYLPGLKVVSIQHYTESIYAGLIDTDYYRTAVAPSDPLEDPTGLIAAIITVLVVTTIATWLSARRLGRLNLE